MAVASLKLTALALGAKEITTYRLQVRIKPVGEGFGLTVVEQEEGSTYHPVSQTLNLDPPVNLGGEALARWVEGVLRTAAGELAVPGG